MLGFPFNISATAEASDFKFGMQLEFAKSHHKIPPRRKEERGPKLGELPKMWGFSLIFMQCLKVLTSNLVHSVGGQFGPSKNHTNDKSRHRSRHGTFSTKLGIPY